MGTIFLVRHGQDQDNAAGILNGRRNTSLTWLGRQQAKAVGKKLKDNGIEVVYSSPLNRARETAEIIVQELGLAGVTTHEGLIERDFGILTGKLVVDIPKYVTNILTTDRVSYFLEAEGAEVFPSLLTRAKQVLTSVQIAHPEQHILLVTHGDMGKMIRAVFHGWSWEEGLKTPYLDNTGVFELNSEMDTLE